MANLQIKGMDDAIYSELKALAASEHRSVSQQVLYMLRGHLARKGRSGKDENARAAPVGTLRFLGGSKGSQDQIVEDLRASRKNSEKIGEAF